jgi:hypothetical protein
MGRIHKIGQNSPVLFINIVEEDTKEGQVLNAILTELENLGNILGEDTVFDVI